ncbi:hypothetical protein DID88_010041 [Monilinia fructigena]|uniref:Uncharacterized protein n=1 Tax=Monilinia fructigena TaxID=38457 RepID=A0A395INH1_9HELO|nr:hypothetical protein DID88_010041 [Monilinia fructigena]
MPTHSRSRLDKEEGTMKRPNIPEMQNFKYSHIDGLTEAPQKPEKKILLDYYYTEIEEAQANSIRDKKGDSIDP